MWARNLEEALCGVRGGARRKSDEGVAGVCREMVEVRRCAILATDKSNAVAADCTADLRISRAQVAVLVVRQRLLRTLFRQCVCDAMRQAAQLCEQQGGYQQESGEQGAEHDAHYSELFRSAQ